jgi:putative ABC transport system permease protein
MWLLAWKNTTRRHGQSLMTVIITALTIFTFVLVFSVSYVMQEGLTLSSQRLGADVLVLPDAAKADPSDILFTAAPTNVYMPKDIVEKVSRYHGVEQASPQFFTQTLSEGCCSLGEETRVVGYDAKTDFMLKPFLKELNVDYLADDQVIIGSQVGDFLGNKMVILGEVFTVVGTLHSTGSGMDNTIFLNIDTARRLAQESAELQDFWRDAPPEDLVSSVMIKTQKGVDPNEVAREINIPGLAVQAIATSDTINSTRAQTEVINKAIFGLWISSMLIAALALIGRFNSLARERKKEIGMLRAMGIQKKQIFQLILSEAWILSFLGGVLGSILGCIGVTPILSILKDTFILPSGIWSFTAALKSGSIGILLALILGFIASAYPAWESAGLDPQEAITQGVLG